MRFRIPDELEAGVYRQGVGHFLPGDEFSIPDAASPLDDDGNPLPYKPHHLIEPLDAEADACLLAAYKGTPREATLKRFGAKPKVSKAAKADAKATKAGADKADGPLGYTGK